MKYLITISDETTEEKVFCDNESEATALIEQKVRDGVSENSVSVYAIEPVDFQVESVPVVKWTSSDDKTDALPDGGRIVSLMLPTPLWWTNWTRLGFIMGYSVSRPKVWLSLITAMSPAASRITFAPGNWNRSRTISSRPSNARRSVVPLIA